MLFMRRFLFILFIVTFCIMGFSQDASSDAIASTTTTDVYKDKAKKIIDKVCAEYESFKSMKVNFHLITNRNGYETVDTIAGVVQGEKYRLSTRNQEIACDGTSVWHYQKDKKELTKSVPNPNDPNLVFPHKMLRLYERDYTPTYLGEAKVGDRTIQKLEFIPKNQYQQIKKIHIYVIKESSQILRVTRYEGKGSRFSLDFRNVLYNVKVDQRVFRLDMS